MSLFHQSPGTLVNLLALLAAGAGIWLLYATRSCEQTETAYLHNLTEQSPIDEPVQLMDVSTLRMIRQNYRIGSACLALAVLLSWISTKF